MKYQPANLKAGLVTSLFALFVVASAFLFPIEPTMLVLHGLILLHTFLSIRCFSALIDVHDLRQWAIDILLVFSYAVFAFAMRDILLYFVALTWVFFVATMKYALLIGRLQQPILLQRKITADILGMAFGGISYAMTSLNFPYASAVLIAIFAAATLYYLIIAPLYVPDHLVKR